VHSCNGTDANAAAANAWNSSNIALLQACYEDDCSNIEVNSNFNFRDLNLDCGTNVGSITVTYTITDVCDNETIVRATFTIEDDEDPILSGIPENTTVECDAIPDAPTVNITDNCDENVTLTFNEDSSQSNNPNSCEYYNYTLTRTWSARDACNNEVTETQVITVRDTEAPEVCCEDIVLQLGENGEVSFNPEDLDCGATDNCSSALNFSASDSSFDLNDIGENTVTLTVEDACGNEDQCSATVTVESFDLALRKEMAAGEDTRVYTGEEVTFTITVFNQGTLIASDVEVTDYIPNGFQLADSDWSNNGGGTASITIPGNIAPGASRSVDITLLVTENTM